MATAPLSREIPAIVRKPTGEDPFAARQGAEPTPPALPLREFDPPAKVKTDSKVAQAGFEEPAAEPKALAARGAAAPPSSEATPLTELPEPAPTRPWLPLTATLLALCGSLGANFYLGWLLSGQRSRYRELATRLQSAGTPSPPAPADDVATG